MMLVASFLLPALLERAEREGIIPPSSGPAAPSGEELRDIANGPPNGRELVGPWAWKSPQEYDDLCLGAVAAFWVSLEWVRLELRQGPDICHVYVTADALAVGTAERMRLAPTMAGAQRILDLFSALGFPMLFPAPRIVDAARGQSRVVLTPTNVPHPGSLKPADWLANQERIERQRAGRSGLVSTVGKELCLFPEMAERGLAAYRDPSPSPGSICEPIGPKVSFYGWHTTAARAPRTGPFDAHDPSVAGPGVHVLQPVSSCHRDPFHDYAQCLRPVSRLAYWNGQRADLAQLYRTRPSMFHRGATRPIPWRWPGPMPAQPKGER